MFEKKASTRFPINQYLANRWSGRIYDPDKYISTEDRIILAEAARWSPSCFGDEPWRFIFCDKSNNEDAWQNAFDCLVEGNQSWARNAPLLIMISSDTLFARNENPNRWGSYDTGAAAMGLSIQATEMGIMVHQMGGFNVDKARQVFAIPERFTPMAMMTAGYQIAMESIPEDMKERELAERVRKPLEECFYDGEWGKSLS
ncbi:MAG: nitroreductase family protein [Gammaproteobacteria bacterium]|nr:nitroreductase family protein [Gammaproteobacteria bacterium]